MKVSNRSLNGVECQFYKIGMFYFDFAKCHIWIIFLLDTWTRYIQFPGSE